MTPTSRMRVPASYIGLLGQRSCEDHVPIMRKVHLGCGGAGHSRMVALIATGWQAERIYTPASLGCATPLGSVMDVITTIMADDHRGRAGSSIYSGPLHIPAYLHSDLWLIRFQFLVNIDSALFCHSSNLLVQLNHPLNFPASMVCERQRMLSQRGSSKGRTSRRPAAEETRPPCHCFCHCPSSAASIPLGLPNSWTLAPVAPLMHPSLALPSFLLTVVRVGRVLTPTYQSCSLMNLRRKEAPVLRVILHLQEKKSTRQTWPRQTMEIRLRSRILRRSAVKVHLKRLRKLQPRS